MNTDHYHQIIVAQAHTDAGTIQELDAIRVQLVSQAIVMQQVNSTKDMEKENMLNEIRLLHVQLRNAKFNRKNMEDDWNNTYKGRHQEVSTLQNILIKKDDTIESQKKAFDAELAAFQTNFQTQLQAQVQVQVQAQLQPLNLAHQARVLELERQLADKSSERGILASRITELGVRKSDLTAYITKLQTQKSDLSTHVTKLETQVTELQTAYNKVTTNTTIEDLSEEILTELRRQHEDILNAAKFRQFEKLDEKHFLNCTHIADEWELKRSNLQASYEAVLKKYCDFKPTPMLLESERYTILRLQANFLQTNNDQLTEELIDRNQQVVNVSEEFARYRAEATAVLRQMKNGGM